MTPAIETWRPIPGWEGCYEASDLGRIRSVERTVYAGQGRYRRSASKVLAPQRHSANGERRVVKLSRDGLVSTQRIAPLILSAFVGTRPQGAECCHGDGDPANDRLSNLRWDTRDQNRRDTVAHGTDHNARKTHCPRGHLLVLPNLTASMWARGWRKCLACNRAESAAAYAHRRGRPFDIEFAADAHYAQIMEGRHVQAIPHRRR